LGIGILAVDKGTQESSLQQLAMADMQLAHGPRFKATPYTLHAPSTLVSALRKSARNHGDPGGVVDDEQGAEAGGREESGGEVQKERYEFFTS
jgi:hypothetical protein